MSDVQSILIDDARQALLREIATVTGHNSLQEAFAAWLCPGAVPGLDINGAVQVAVETVGAGRNFTHVAILGLAAQTRALSSRENESLIAGLDVTVNREPVVAGTPMGFCMNGVALASVVMAANATGDHALWTKTQDWLRRCRAATAGGLGLDCWQEWLLWCVASHTGAKWERRAGEGIEDAAVRVALQSRGISSVTSEDSDDERKVLGLIRQTSQSGIGTERAAIRLAALDWIRRDRPVCNLRNVTASEIGDLLRRIPAGLKKWTWESRPRTAASTAPRQWQIENEYHVQNMLWLVLAPFLPDLVDEDSTPKVGPVQPRADIGVPSLRLIIEAKFMRANDPPKKMVEQIAQDASLYRVSGSKYDKLIAFIWDDSRRTEHHAELIQGLLRIAGVADAVIVSRPGGMIAPDASEKDR